jgi:transposase
VFGVIEVDQYQIIRHLHSVQGVSQREIARQLGISRNTVRRYANGENVPWTRAASSGKQSSVLSPEVISFVKAVLEEDETAPKKQKHTARRIYERLCDECGFTGGESTILNLVSELKKAFQL